MNCRATSRLLISLFLLLLILLASVYAIKCRISNDTNTKAVLNEQDSFEGEFIIREYNGIVCVFHKDYTEIPAIVTKISVNTLNESDKALIMNGIRAASRKEVLKYLEDFEA
jgi:hypothetical protein